MQSTRQLAILLPIAGLLIAGLVWIVQRYRRPPGQRERRRRLAVSRLGRLCEAIIDDVSSDTIYYSYSVRGVYYTACQDISTIREFLPDEPERLIGAATLKYLTRNPANSILVSEDWSGIRAPKKLSVRDV